MDKRPPSPRPSPSGEGARRPRSEPNETCSPRSHRFGVFANHMQATDVARRVHVSPRPSGARPLLGERVGVRAVQSLFFI